MSCLQDAWEVGTKSSRSHADLDIATLEAARNVLAGIRPTLIVNTAAMHHVENCEKEPLKAYQINALRARHLANAARELGAKLLHVNADYVFDGSKKQPYLESDLAAPLNVYGNTKLAGERSFVHRRIDTSSSEPLHCMEDISVAPREVGTSSS